MQPNQLKFKPYLYCRIIALMLLLLAGIFSLNACEKGPGQQAPGARPAPEVAVVTITPQSVELTTELPGRTTAYRVAEIRPQVNGLIQKRLFTEGAAVKAGDVLYQIDPAPFRAVLENANAALVRSKASLPALESRVERYKELLDEKAVSQQDYDDADAALKQAQADVQYWSATVETARINLAYTRINAPISGQIGRSGVTEGAIVTAYQPIPLATIQQLDPIYVDVTQSTTEQMRIRQKIEQGQLSQNEMGRKKVRLILEGDRLYSLEGTLQFSDVSVDPTTGSFILRIVVPNPDGVLLPGMFVRARILEGVNEEAILVPQQGVSRDPKGNPYALVVEDGDMVGQRMLTLDRAIGDKWLAVSGLAPGDRIIVEGLQKVRPGMSVRVTPAAENMSGDEQKTDNRKTKAGTSTGISN